jgi:hypothetical protein
MAYNKLKISKTIALEKIEKQIAKGSILGKKGIEFIRNNPNHSISRSEIDKFKVELEQWIDITESTLYEIYHSSKYGYDFKNHRASKKEYVSSSWQPDIRYYVEYEVLPKLDYLKILKSNTVDLEEIKQDDENSISKPETKPEEHKAEVPKINIENYNFEKITIPQLKSLLSIPQIVKIISTIFGLLVVAFWIGFYANEFTTKKSNEDLIKVVNDLSKEVKQLRIQSDSLKINLNKLTK